MPLTLTFPDDTTYELSDAAVVYSKQLMDILDAFKDDGKPLEFSGVSAPTDLQRAALAHIDAVCQRLPKREETEEKSGAAAGDSPPASKKADRAGSRPIHEKYAGLFERMNDPKVQEAIKEHTANLVALHDAALTLPDDHKTKLKEDIARLAESLDFAEQYPVDELAKDYLVAAQGPVDPKTDKHILAARIPENRQMEQCLLAEPRRLFSERDECKAAVEYLMQLEDDGALFHTMSLLADYMNSPIVLNLVAKAIVQKFVRGKNTAQIRAAFGITKANDGFADDDARRKVFEEYKETWGKKAASTFEAMYPV